MYFFCADSTSSTSTSSSSPVQSTADALNNAKRSLDKSDLLSAAVAINQLKGESNGELNQF